MKKNLFTIAIVLFLACLESYSQTVIDFKKQGEPFDHYWSRCVGAGRANEGLRAGWLEQLKIVRDDCGFQYVRFHGLFHDDMFPYFEKNEKITYNWQYIDELFDRMSDIGVKPFVELAFFPKQLAAENGKTQFWWRANVTPDNNKYDKWHDLVKAFTQHCVDRYGIDEVLTWYFEVWNEPNLNTGFWDGTRSQYFELYKTSALALKSIDSRFRVGGPSTSNFVADDRFSGEVQSAPQKSVWNKNNINDIQWQGVWIEEFLKYCKREKLPLDFISTHPYPTDYALNPETSRYEGLTRYVKSTYDDLIWLKGIIAKSAYPKAEIHLTEWSTSPNSRDAIHDYLPPAAYIIKVNLDCIGLANSLSYWTFTDIFEEKGGAESIFHGGFGMINYQGLLKPSFHAYRMLNQLGNEKIFNSEGLFVSRSSSSKKIIALLYNYPHEYYNAVPQGNNKHENGSARKITFSLNNLPPDTAFKVEVLDKDHGNIYNVWESIGKPEPPTREQTRFLKEQSNATLKFVIKADGNGTLKWERSLTPWECVLISQL